MTTITLARGTLKPVLMALIFLTAAFFFMIVGGAVVVLSRLPAAEVPLKPCRQCSAGCPCPRLSGSVRCGCPQ